jgi:trimethylamine--corrinoid protein Co-methyltransferase
MSSASPIIALLDEEEKRAIHERSLRILQHVGIQYNSEPALKLLEGVGCNVDYTSLCARIPPHVVDWALGSAPRQFQVAGRAPGTELTYGSGHVYLSLDGGGNWTLDMETKKRRPAVSADLRQAIRLADALDAINHNCAIVIPHDIPEPMRMLRILELQIRNSSKPFFISGGSDMEIAYALEILEAVVGDRKALKERPLVTVVYAPVSPLQADPRYVRSTLEWAKYGLPVIIVPFPLIGGTSPVTLAGAVLQHNVEVLSGVVLCQAANPGTPILYSAGNAVLDMRSGHFSSAAVENVLTGLALIEMAQFYDLPSSAGAGNPDAKLPGFQAGIESMATGIVNMLAGVDLLWGGTGLLDGITSLYLPYLLLNIEGIRQAERLRAGIAMDDAHYLFDAIVELGFLGDYLGHPSTKKLFRQEHLLPDLFPRQSYESWKAVGLNEEELARSRVEEILAGHVPEPLDPGSDREISRIMHHAESRVLND